VLYESIQLISICPTEFKTLLASGIKTLLISGMTGLILVVVGIGWIAHLIQLVLMQCAQMGVW
jgi:hypothetical protein